MALHYKEYYLHQETEAEFVRELPTVPETSDKARQLPTAISVLLQSPKSLAESPRGLDFHPGHPNSQPPALLGTTASSVHTKESGEDEVAGQSRLHGPKQYKLKPDSHSLHIGDRSLNLCNVFTHPGDFCK